MTFLNLRFLLVVCALSLMPSAFAAVDPYYEIADAVVTEVAADEQGAEAVIGDEAYVYEPQLGLGNISINEIVNYAKALWQVIEANRPVVNLKLDHGNALPLGSESWMRLGHWMPPAAKAYRITYKNGFGMDVVDFTFKLVYTYGGKLDGKGQYLTNVAVHPTNLSVAWGFTFNANAQVSAVTNAGAQGAPLAAMQMDVHWSVDTPVQHRQQTESYYVRGDGYFQQL